MQTIRIFRYFINVIIFTFSLSCFAQNCCPYIGPSTIIPSYASQNDEVTLYTFIGTTSNSGRISRFFTLGPLPKTIEAELCYWTSGALSAPYHVDTFSLGKFLPGVYTVTILARLSHSTNVCVTYTSNTSTTTFTVFDNPADIASEKPLPGKVYPNPVKDYLFVESDDLESTVTQLELYTSTGECILRECFGESNFRLYLGSYPPGLYYLRLNEKLTVLVKE